MKKAIYVITGLMASGKSTVSEQLATRLPACVHLRGDIFRRMIISGREEMSSQPSEEAFRQLQLRYRLATDAAKTYYDNGFSVVLQDNYYGRELPNVLAMLDGYPVHTVVLCPSAETVEAREQTRGKVGYVGFTVRELYEGFMLETPRIGLWLDTSDLSPAQTVDAILEHLQAVGA